MDAGAVFYSSAGQSFLSEYVELTDVTVDNFLSNLKSRGDRFDKELAMIDKEIARMKANKKKAEAVSDLIREAKSFLELSRIVNEAGIEGADLDRQVREKQYTERIFDEMINGKIKGYNKRGKPIKKGGVGEMRKYCLGFNITDTPPDNSKITYSIENPLDLISTGDIDIIDPYDPLDDIRDLGQKDDDQDYDPGTDDEGKPKCRDSETIRCMGDLDMAMKGLVEDVKIDRNKVLVYRVTPENRSVPSGKFKLSNKGVAKIRFSLGEDYEVNTSESKCQASANSGKSTIFGFTSGFSGIFCPVDEEKTYFLRVYSSGDSSFDINTYGDGSSRGGQTSPSADCKSGSNVICMGKIDLYNINHEKRDVRMIKNKANV